MEEILKKEIFADSALLKLSPDYCPNDIILRLQTRRSLVKDAHCHRIKRHNSISRKNYKQTTLDFSKTEINKELTKLKSTFQSRNLKNTLDLKRCNNKRNNIQKKTVELADLFLNEQDIIDSENNNLITLLKIDKENDFNDDDDPIVNIDATLHLLKVNGNKCSETEVSHTIPINELKSDKTLIQAEKSNGLEVQDCIGDLQSLLIQMAITTYSNDCDSEDHSNFNKNRAEDYVEVETDVQNLSEMSSSTTLNDVDFLKIEPIRQKLGEWETHLLRKYAKKWKEFVKIRRDYCATKRQSVLNNFFDKLEKRKNSQNELSATSNKASLLARDYKTYQHRYKVQKHIIALQKAKLEEQNRTIDELKYNKIVEASKISVDAMKEEVRKTYYEMDRQLKPKMKCLTNELKLHELEEPSLALHCLKVPQFLQRMEKRAREREEKHAVIRERRQQMEEERIRLKQQAELAKVEMDKEEKMFRMKELKEKRKREKMESIRKKQYAEKMRALTVMADLHYEKRLKERMGLRPWKQLLEIKRLNIERARSHHNFQLLKNCFLHWMWYAEDQCYERNFIADSFHKKKVLGKAFEALKINHRNLVLKKQVAEDYYDLFVVQLVFRKFRVGIALSQQENNLKMQKAIAYQNSNLKFKIFTCWRTLPALNALKREQEARKSRWRQKVLQVVPDYAPPDD